MKLYDTGRGSIPCMSSVDIPKVSLELVLAVACLVVALI